MTLASENVVAAAAAGYDSMRQVKRSRALLGSNPTRNSRADGAPKARGPAGDGPQASFHERRAFLTPEPCLQNPAAKQLTVAPFGQTTPNLGRP